MNSQTTFRPTDRDMGLRRLRRLTGTAAVAGAARYGPDWYRQAGRGPTRGTAVVTVSGPVGRPGVREIELGTPAGEVLASTGLDRAEAQAVLLGGYFGTWAGIDDAWAAPLDPPALRSRGLTFGAGVLTVLGAEECGVAATARIVAYMAGESAAQCGPCVFGLTSLADATRRVAGLAAEDDDLARIERWTAQVRGRGACAHPDGAVGLLASALDAFGSEFELHLRHRQCSAVARRARAA